MLGHELRGPLDAVLLTAQLLQRLPEGTPPGPYVERMTRGGERMKALLDDLLDHNRAALGFGIAVNREIICSPAATLTFRTAAIRATSGCGGFASPAPAAAAAAAVRFAADGLNSR